MSRQTSSTAQWDWGEQLIRPLEKIAERVAAYDPDDATSDFEEMLLEPLSISGGESFTAEDHRGREILELLQNAQDASGGLYEPDSDPDIGTRGVYIGISNDGLVVANTGDSFDFSDPDRRKSLRILGHSETSAETIGQFGVGLTSIRSMGEAYEVWTKSPDRSGRLDLQDCWRVFCGPRTTLAAIASAVPNARGEGAGNDAYERFRETAICGEDILDFSTNGNPLESVPLSADQIPYFTYPVAMESWNQSHEAAPDRATENPLRDRARDLLTNGEESDSNLESCPTEIQSLLSEVGAFTTAVFVDFEDDDWRALFEAITGTEPASPDQNPAARLEEQAWFANSDTDRVTPELLLNLGHIDRLVVERFGDSSEEPSSLQSWEVFGRHRVKAADAENLPMDSREIRHGSESDEVAVRKVAVQLETSCTHDHLDSVTETGMTTYTFWDAEFTNPNTYDDYHWYEEADIKQEDGKETDVAENDDIQVRKQNIEVSVLLQTINCDGDRELYAPHLYYPISGAKKQFPYCIHGDFVVQQNRQSLAGSGLKRNCVVAAEAAKLVGELSEAIATTADLPKPERAAIPWRLLPTPVDDSMEDEDWPVAKEVAAESTGQVADNEPLRVLSAEIFRCLRLHKNIQVVSADESQASISTTDRNTQAVFLHHNVTFLAGISALYPLVTYADPELAPTRILEHADASIDLPIPTGWTLEALLRWLVDEHTLSGEHNNSSSSEETSSDLEHRLTCLLRHLHDGEIPNRSARLAQLVIGDNNETNLATKLLTPWWSVLQSWSKYVDSQTGVGCAISDVPPDTARALLETTVLLGDNENSFPAGRAFTPEDEGPYLLPCNPFVEEQESSPSGVEVTQDSVQLVRVESHETRGEHQRQVLRPQHDGYENVVPGSETGFALYILSGVTSPESLQVIKAANWGTREYAGAADLYRTLLRDIGEDSTQLSIADFRFLITVYDLIDFDSQTTLLDAVEGGYHPHDQIENLATSATVVYNLKPRVSARQVSIPSVLLDTDESKPGSTVRFGSDLLREWLANHFDTASKEETSLDDVVEGDPENFTKPPIRTQGAVATLPNSENEDSLIEDSPAEIATQLGMLGVSVLPNVQSLLLRGDDVHPDRQNVSSWNPTAWSVKSTPRLFELTEILNSPVGKSYLDLLVTPPFGPGESSDHTPNCTVEDYPKKADETLYQELTNYGVMLTSWLWLPSERLADIDATELATLLTLYGDALSDSILQTGWSCDNGKGNTQSIEKFVPTLLNWQLRTVTDWSEIDWFHNPSMDELWVDCDVWDLQYAVLEEEINGRRTAASAFPRIDLSESPISETVWRTLGVKKLEELNATEAAVRLDALISGAYRSSADSGVVDNHDADEQSDKGANAPELPGIDAIDAWQTLYGRLLGTIGDELQKQGGGMTLEKLQFLDRVPAQNSDGNWVGLSCEALETAVYYDSTESDWENRLSQLKTVNDEFDNADAELRDSKYLLPRPQNRYIGEDEFKALWEKTAAREKPAQYPEIEHSKTTDAENDILKKTLEMPEIKYGVLAAAPGSEARTDHRNQYEKITETLRRIAHDEGDSVKRETAWQVTPVDGESGLKLDNVETDANYAIAYDERVINDPTEPVELADLFMALYDGGNKDSYKLALLGRDVEGKETVREQLRATDVQELETDLRLAAALFDRSPTIEPGVLTPTDEMAVSDFRQDIARCLEDSSLDRLSAESTAALDESVMTAIDAMCTSDLTELQSLASELIRTANTRIETLQSGLRTDDPHDVPSNQQLSALKRLEETLPVYRSRNRLPAFNDLLPKGQPQRVTKTLRDLITGMQEYTRREPLENTSLVDLRAQSPETERVWADRIFLNGDRSEWVDFGLSSESNNAIYEGDTTWFHIAWWLASADQSPIETSLAETLVEAVAVFLDGTLANYRNKIQKMANESQPTSSGQQTGSSSSNNAHTESNNTTLFDQIASDTDWEHLSDGYADDYTATPSSLDSGGTGKSGGSADGPITQTGDQPRVAELNVLQRSYEALVEADLSPDTIQAQLAEMRRDHLNYWRPELGWENNDIFPVEELPDPDELGQSGVEFPTEALDITDEGAAGYDILDLTGWAVRQDSDISEPSDGIDLTPYQDPKILTPVPVEVKSVDPDRPSFKFSLNQYQRAYAFVTPVGERGSVPYVLYLVEVQQYQTDEGREYSVRPYDTVVITCPTDLRQLLPPELSPDENEDLVDTLINSIYGGDLMISR